MSAHTQEITAGTKATQSMKELIVNKYEYLQHDRAMTQKWLSCFDVSTNPILGIGPSSETFWIKDFPLPDKYQPDRLSLVMEVSNYPQVPPKGIYLLSTETN